MISIDEVKPGDMVKVVGIDSLFLGQIVEVVEVDKAWLIVVCKDKDGDPVGFNIEHLELYDSRHLCSCERFVLINRGCKCGGR